MIPKKQQQTKQQQQQQQQYETALDKRRVEVYLVRHGYSIANRFMTPDEENYYLLEKTKGGLGKLNEPDPSLTRTGVLQSKDASQNSSIRNINPHYIFSSVLCRAQQTALFMFPIEQNVIVAPYLKEENNTADISFVNTDNKPFEDIYTQYEKRHNLLTNQEINRLVYSKNVLKEGECLYNKNAREEPGEITSFLKNFLHPFLRDSIKPTQGIENEPIRVAVVCHGGIIRNFLGIKHTNNNAVYKVSFKKLSDILSLEKPPSLSQKIATALSQKITSLAMKRHRQQSTPIRKQQTAPAFTFIEIFGGFDEKKLTCKNRPIQGGTQQLVRISYPRQQMVSMRPRSMSQFKDLYIGQITKSSIGFGSSRIKKIIDQVKRGSQNPTIKSFLQRHPGVQQKQPKQIQSLLQADPDIIQLVFEPSKAFQKLIKNIQTTHQLRTPEDTLQFLNTMLMGVPDDKVFQKLNTLMSQT